MELELGTGLVLRGKGVACSSLACPLSLVA
jgi:hypothetical protein